MPERVAGLFSQQRLRAVPAGEGEVGHGTLERAGEPGSSGTSAGPAS